MPSEKKSTSKPVTEATKQNETEVITSAQQQIDAQLKDEDQKDVPTEEEAKADPEVIGNTDAVGGGLGLQRHPSVSEPQLSKSWYGTWPKKSRESVVLESSRRASVKTETEGSSIQSKEIPIKRTPLISPGSSGRSLPLVATTTKLNISSEPSKLSGSIKNGDLVRKSKGDIEDDTHQDDTAIQSKPEENQPVATAPGVPTGTLNPVSWLSWSRGDRPFLPSISFTSPLSSGGQAIKAESIDAGDSTKVDTKIKTLSSNLPASDSVDKTEQMDSSAWYPRWAFGGSAVPEISKSTVPDSIEVPIPVPNDRPVFGPEQNKVKSEDETKQSSWAFWSNTTAQGNNASGQLAVANSSTQSHPEPAVIREGSPVLTTDDKKKRPLSQGDEPVKKKQAGTSTLVVKKLEEKIKEVPNILLPTFASTYSVHWENPSIWQQLGNWVYAKNTHKHPILLKEPRRFRRALAIGVHGYFPTAIVQTLLGKPTGTSIKFAESAAKAIETFTKAHGYSLQSLDKIALEGEGRIDERLDILWKLLLNWIHLIRKADFILVACHSQGVPVAISLVSKLIGFGCVTEARIGICAMAGISRGPFAEYKSRWIGGSAAELFEFSDPTSSVSRAYTNALETVLRFGVKVVYVGSLDDQLVPLHSSTFTSVNHPNIYRAVFVDRRMHVANFICHLVGFALKLRNLGTSDHGLIRELSNPLAGSLVGGEGHSRVYDDPAVYK